MYNGNCISSHEREKLLILVLQYYIYLAMLLISLSASIEWNMYAILY